MSDTVTAEIINTPTASQEVAPSATQTQTPVTETVVDTTPTETVVTEAPKPSESESTLLGEKAETAETPEKTADDVVTDVTVPEAEVKDEGGQSDETAPPPVFEAFVVPEGVTLDNERMGKFTDILSDLETKTKADHVLLQETGQKLVDYHINEMKSAQEAWVKYAQETWENQKKSWKDEVLSDPSIGGPQFQTNLDSALEFIRTHGGTAEEQKELRDTLESSGLGNHKAIIRTFANAGKALAEGRPLAAQKPVSAPKSKVATMYGRNAQ